MAKAVAAFLTPLVLLAVAALGRWVGVDIGQLDPTQVEQWLVAAVTALAGSVWVYWQRNTD